MWHADPMAAISEDADPAARVLAADHALALLGAQAYMRDQFPGAQREWGAEPDGPLPEPGEIDQIWLRPAAVPGGSDTWFAIAACCETYDPGERARAARWGAVPGTRDYLFFAAGRLRETGQQRIAGVLEAQTLASRLVYLAVTTCLDGNELSDVRARQFDISDETLAAAVLAAAAASDWDTIERLKRPIGPGAADLLAAGYWTLPGWQEKALLGLVAWNVRDHTHAGVRAVFEDLITIPDTRGDTAREARTAALTWLDSDNDPAGFADLYNDGDALDARMAAYQRRLGNSPGAPGC